MRRLTADRLTGLFTIGACASVALLCWFGYRAVSEWRARSLLLAERQAHETADLLLTALARDMAGVQTSVLTSPEWNQFIPDHPHEVNELVASAFARYPYPDAFFAWKTGVPFNASTFYYRAARSPAWATPSSPGTLFPVEIGRHARAADELFRNITLDAARGRSLSFFEVSLNGVPYQVVAQLVYDDVYRQELSSVFGFTVNLPWIREHYFTELTKQVWTITPTSVAGLAMHVRDPNGSVVAGWPFDETQALTVRRTFELLFLDVQSAPPTSRNFVPETWSIAVTGEASPFMREDSAEANRVLALAAVSSLVFAIGLLMIARAVRASARLTTMRSDFVSAVTHELKTPIATIKAAAETLAKDRLTGMSVHACGRIVMMETSRLGRLVENLLAYSRMTDVTDTYVFKPIEVAAIFNDIQEDFEARLDRDGFELGMTIGSDVHCVDGDRFALRLLFGNLVDNAIKYSSERRSVRLNATRVDHWVVIEVSDQGSGIASHELPQVVKKFVRANGATGAGSGLGLAIAIRIAGDHRGSLDIHSTVGVGTTVIVRLPAVEHRIDQVA